MSIHEHRSRANLRDVVYEVSLKHLLVAPPNFGGLPSRRGKGLFGHTSVRFQLRMAWQTKLLVAKPSHNF